MTIKYLNDQLRANIFTGLHGQILLTQGITRMPKWDKADIFVAIRDFHSFNQDNDPHGEHDFGALEYAGKKILWKIDYYDKDDQDYGSSNPADPAVTLRVLTIMLAEDY